MPKTLAELLADDSFDPMHGAAAPLDVYTFDTSDAATFAKAILSSREYRESIRHRLILGELPPAVEVRLFDYAFGKPIDKVEHSGRVDTRVERVERVIVEAPSMAALDAMTVTKH